MLLFKHTSASMLLCLMPLLVMSEHPTSPLPRIHVEQSTGHFVDQYGRVRMFRGINSVLKSPPWYEVRRGYIRFELIFANWYFIFVLNIYFFKNLSFWQEWAGRHLSICQRLEGLGLECCKIGKYVVRLAARRFQKLQRHLRGNCKGIIDTKLTK